MNVLKALAGFALVGVATAGAFIYSGIYPMGADVPHNAATYWALETLRENSIARASKGIEVPPLDNPELLLAGGPDYNEMCATCHLKPGKQQSDLSLGLYPKPPNLAAHVDDDDREHGDPQQAGRRQFWIIKHGIKASGMPAWGSTHDDKRIWAMVAFIQKLPELTPAQYQILTERDEPTHH